MKLEKKTSFWKIFFASLLALVVASVLFWVIFFTILGSSFKASSFNIEEKTILHLTLDKPILEISDVKFNPNTLEFDESVGLNDILMALEIAADDKKVSGLFIDICSAPMGFSTLHELRAGIQKFKESGKFVLSYNSGETVSQKALLLSSVAEESYVYPTSVVQFLGLGAELIYFKNMLDKLSIEMQVVRGEGNDFKSAVEPFFLDKMSDSSRLQTQRLLELLWLEYRETLASARKVSPEYLDSLAQTAMVRKGTHAVKHKLYDGAKYRDEIISILKEKTGVSSDKELKIVDFMKYAKNKSSDKKVLDEAKNPNIAVLFAEGDISRDGEGIASERLVKEIRKIRENNKIKALVLRVNSPGGSALASDEIWRELQLFSETKTLVVSMGDVAASGGYYISAPAHRIFAQRSTITGSIGVFGVIPYTGKMFKEKLGIDFDYVHTNQYANLSLNKPLSSAEMGMIQEEVDDIYADFLTLVSKGRNLTLDHVKKIAKGRVWIGEDAVKIGLVDELGGLRDAMSYAAKKAEIDKPIFDYYPKIEENKISQLLMELANEDIQSKLSMAPVGAEAMKMYRTLRVVSSLNGVQARLPFLIQID
jgi:protease-4